MKTIILICAFVLINLNAKAQGYCPLETFGTDTITYLQHNFIDRKDQYIGHSFEKLMNDYELFLIVNTKRTYPFAPGANGNSFIHGVNVLYTYDSNVNPYGILSIEFTSPHWEWDQLRKMIHNLDDDKELARLLKDCIIEDIQLEIYPEG